MRETHNTEEHFSDFLYTTVQYIPLLATLVAIGLLAIYLLAQAGLLGSPAWQLLAVTGTLLFVALSHLPISRLAHEGRGQLAYLLYALAMGITGVLFVLFWENITPVAILIAWIAPLTSLAVGFRRRYLLPSVSISAVTTAGLILLDRSPIFERLSNTNAAALAALVLLGSTVTLFVLATILARLIRYRTLQSRLIVSFILIITVPILFITFVSAANAFTNSQNQFRDTLQSIASLKENQIDAKVQQDLAELTQFRDTSSGSANIRYILQHSGETDELYQVNLSLASTGLRDYLVQHEGEYRKFMVVNKQGEVVLSTYVLDVGQNLANQKLFRQGRTNNFSGLVKSSGQQEAATPYEYTLAEPLYASDGSTALGVLVVTGDSTFIDQIMETTPGLSNAETYLVDQGMTPITKTRFTPNAQSAEAIRRAITNQSINGTNVYSNYAGVSVLGYNRGYPALQATFMAEIPQSEVFSKAISTLLASGLVGIFAIAVAVITVLSTSRAISEPVSALSKAAEQFAAGHLDTRARSDQQDEIGNLARSFNSMADQLEEIIGSLERRVAEHTQDLEQQTLRLRTAAEVARDAASAPSLDELLDRAGRLIRDRFDLYHTGIFLLDDKKEYAVLRASPTEAGRQMLANNHRLQVGEQGIVGRAAATGEPRIALDIGADPVYFSNPFLPDTHSEMALPLKTNQGIIGVLDIQSDQPEAFTQDDIAIMQVMADQLATAIERTLLLHQLENSLVELERTYSGFTQQSWKMLERGGRQIAGYRFDNVRLEPLQSVPEEAKAALEKDATIVNTTSIQTAESGQLVTIPVRLRGQTIGVVNIRFQYDQAPEKTVAMIEQIADRLATALENARLLEDSLRRANKERVIGEITSKISASINMRNVLQTAVEELGRAIPGSDVVIQLQPGTDGKTES